MELMEEFLRAVSEASNQPTRSFEGLRKLAEQTVGLRLLTLLSADSRHDEASRIYSSMPDVYPVFGRKPIPEGAWFNTVIRNGQIFRAQNIREIAAVFPDHEKIASLGCGAILNIPVVAGGKLLGCINCLDVESAYGDNKMKAARNLILPGMACFAIANSMRDSGDEI